MTVKLYHLTPFIMPTHKDEVPKMAFLHSWGGNDIGQQGRYTPAHKDGNVEELYAIQTELGLTGKEMARIMDMSESTLLRRYRDKEAMLSPHQSDILAHLMLVVIEGLSVYESMPVLRQWLTMPLPALGNQVPKELLWTIHGRSKLLEVFNQLKHGYTF